MPALFSIQVRCLACQQVVPAVSERRGWLMWQHRLPDGSGDCPAWREGTNHEAPEAQEHRDRLARERAAWVREPIAPSQMPSWWESIDRERAAAAEDEYSGDYTDRRAGGSRC